MSERAQGVGEVAGEGADIGAFADDGCEIGVIRIRHPGQTQLGDRDRTGRKVRRPAGSPSANGRMPVASGSSVPACPVFAPVARLICATMRAEVTPSGLSMTSQPCSPGSAGFVIILGIGMEIGLDGGARQQGRDPRGALESVVE